MTIKLVRNRNTCKFGARDASVFDCVCGGGLLVTDEGGTRITGIVTERDYLTKVALRGLNSRVTPVL